MAIIVDLYFREILDSRGNPTVEVEVELEDGTRARAGVPSGASISAFETVERRGGDAARYLGKGVEGAVATVNEDIRPEVAGSSDAENQRGIDSFLIALDGTPNKAKLGVSAILGVSIAVVKAAAKSAGLPLYQYLGGLNAHVLPVPMTNILNGGSHADPNVDIQELMIAPCGADLFKESLRWGSEVYHSPKSMLKERSLATDLDNEDGFAPNLESNAAALDLIYKATEKAGFKPGAEVGLALDVASSEFFADDKYTFEDEAKDTDFMMDYYKKLVAEYPLVFIEDPLSEDEWDAWKALIDVLGDKVQIIGDDFFVTNPERLARGIDLGAANALLMKVNQIGTISETSETVKMAHRNGYRTITSRRSDETEDTTIANLSVATSAGQIKTGAPARGERINKYSQLLRIENQLGENAVFTGRGSFPRYKG